MLLLLARLALAASYTDEVGGAELTVPLRDSAVGNGFLVTHAVELRAVTGLLSAESRFGDIVSVFSYTRVPGDDAWTAGPTAFAFLIDDGPATEQTATFDAPVPLEAGEELLLLFVGGSSAAVEASAVDGAFDTRWGVALGYCATTDGLDAVDDTSCSLHDIRGAWMRLAVDAPDADGDGADTLTDCDDADSTLAEDC
ncbi:MAG: hypothetical protein V4850_16505, partial [Myxococcota bacterium]